MFVAEKLGKKEKFSIVTPNPEIIVAAHKDQELKDSLQGADLSIPDGVGLLWANKLVGNPSITRLPGRKVMIELFKYANDNKLKVYFLGSTEKVMAKLISMTSAAFPHLKVDGSSGPLLSQNAIPITEADTQKEKEVIKEINAFQPDLLFVAFGAPKQEKWLARHIDTLRIGGAMVVGGAFDTYVGEIQPAPELLSHLGLEWLWRLIQEPQRIGRIFTAVVVFPLLVLNEKLRKR